MGPLAGSDTASMGAIPLVESPITLRISAIPRIEWPHYCWHSAHSADTSIIPCLTRANAISNGFSNVENERLIDANHSAY